MKWRTWWINTFSNIVFKEEPGLVLQADPEIVETIEIGAYEEFKRIYNQRNEAYEKLGDECEQLRKERDEARAEVERLKEDVRRCKEWWDIKDTKIKELQLLAESFRSIIVNLLFVAEGGMPRLPVTRSSVCEEARKALKEEK